MQVRSYYLDEKVIDRIKKICDKRKITASGLLDELTKKHLKEILLEEETEHGKQQQTNTATNESL